MSEPRLTYTTDQEQRARQYCMAIRNPRKRDYAWHVLNYWRGNRAEFPQRGELSVMGAQAVQMNLNDIIGGGNP